MCCQNINCTAGKVTEISKYVSCQKMPWENLRKSIKCRSVKIQYYLPPNEKKCISSFLTCIQCGFNKLQEAGGEGEIFICTHAHTASSLSFCKIMNYFKSIPYSVTQPPSNRSPSRGSERVSSTSLLLNDIRCTKCLQKSILLCIVFSVQNEQFIQHQITTWANKSHKKHWIHQCRHLEQKNNQHILNVQFLIWIWNTKTVIMLFQMHK